MNTGGINHSAEMSRLLAEMQSLRQRANLDVPEVKPQIGTPATEKSQPPEFSTMLKGALDQVNELQQTSSELKKAYERGDPGVDLAQVMIASQKSKIGFEAMSQVRNKFVEAYRDVMNMPI